MLLLHFVQQVSSTRFRLHFSAGDRAIQISTSAINGLRSIAQLTSSQSEPDDVLAAVKKLNDTKSSLMKQERKLLGEIAKYEADLAIPLLQKGENAFVHRADGGLEFLNTIVHGIKDAAKDGGLLVLAAGQGHEGGPVVVIGDTDAVAEFVPKMKAVVKNIKGGGRGEKWQGKVTEWGKGELEALQRLVKGA